MVVHLRRSWKVVVPRRRVPAAPRAISQVSGLARLGMRLGIPVRMGSAASMRKQIRPKLAAALRSRRISPDERALLEFHAAALNIAAPMRSEKSVKQRIRRLAASAGKKSR